MTLGDRKRDADPRMRICRMLGLSDLSKVHHWVVDGVKQGAPWLLQHGLNAERLKTLGYTVEAMRGLGASDRTLERLGYPVTAAGGAARSASIDAAAKGDLSQHGNLSQQVRVAVEGGAHASDLRHGGFHVQHVKRAGYTAPDMVRLGFTLGELATVCSAGELRRADFSARELRHYFNGDELRMAGFSASDLRAGGFSARDLIQMGLSENQIRTAGFSHSELIHAGLSRTTRI